MIEVHQTEARNAFQMKTLRCVTAVTEAKVHFGVDLIVVNVLREIFNIPTEAAIQIPDESLPLAAEDDDNIARLD